MSVRRIVLALLGVVALALVWALSRDDGAPPLPRATGTLAVAVPDDHAAGDPLRIEITGAHPEIDQAVVVLTTTAGTRSFDASLDDGTGSVDLTSAGTAAGIADIWVVAGRDEVWSSIDVIAGAPVEPLVPFVGPKSIVADGEDHAMVVVLASDRFGSPVRARSEIGLSALRHTGATETGGVEVTGLVAWQRLFSGTVSGRTAVSTAIGGVQGPVADLDEVAGRPAEIVLNAPEGGPLLADGRRLHRIQTGQLRDRFDNLVTDGTVVEFRMDTVDGRRTSSAPTVDGRAEVWIEAPAAPGVVQVVASSSGTASEPLDVEYRPAVERIPARVSTTETGAVVEIGPVGLVDGGWIPDGTRVDLTMPGQRTVGGSTVDGRVTFELRSRLPERSTVVVLGIEGVVG